MEGTLFLQTTLVPGKEAKRAQGLPRAGREGEWGALIGRAPGEMGGVGSSAWRLKILGRRAIAVSAGERESGRRGKRGEAVRGSSDFGLPRQV